MKLALLIGSGVAATLVASSAFAGTFSGTAYYTFFPGGSQRVASSTYTYDDATHVFSLGAQNTLTNLPGADGLLFAPGGTHLLVMGQGPAIYNVDLSNPTAFTTTNIPGPGAFHPALNGSTVYTSGPYGQSNANLISATTDSNGNLSSIQQLDVTGDDSQVTQLAFAGGKVFYDNSQPNCCGSIGTIDLTTGNTTRIASSLNSAHGMVYDPYTGLIDLFGGGYLGFINPTTNAFGQEFGNGANFDQGAPDGQGHALIAGSDGITFVDYRASHDITHPDYTTFVPGFGGIDDIAPLAGAGSITGPGIPEPATWAMMLVGFGALGAALRRRRGRAFA
jgi:hypothetical protein